MTCFKPHDHFREGTQELAAALRLCWQFPFPIVYAKSHKRFTFLNSKDANPLWLKVRLNAVLSGLNVDAVDIKPRKSGNYSFKVIYNDFPIPVSALFFWNGEQA